MKRLILIVFCLLLTISYNFAQESNESVKFAQSEFLLAQLSKFSEPQIYLNQNEKNEIYRLMIWQAFNSPISLRLESKNNEITLISKQLSGKGGYEVGKIKKETNVKISEKQFQKFKTIFAKLKFLEMETEEKRWEVQANGMIEICLDASTWTLESFFDGNYHAIERYCSDDKNLHAIGFYLNKLSKLKVKKWELF